jgi:aryl-alcohol dehydrogenase-like predicted oxidoreductase
VDRPPVHDQEKLCDTIEELVAIGDELGVSAAQVALAYSMAKPVVTSVMVGAADRTCDDLLHGGSASCRPPGCYVLP